MSVIVLEPVQHDHCAVLEPTEVNDRAEVPRLEREDALRACPHYFRILRDVLQVTYYMIDIVCSLEIEHTHGRQYRPESKKLLYSRTLCFNHMRLLLSHGSNETKLRQQICYSVLLRDRMRESKITAPGVVFKEFENGVQRCVDSGAALHARILAAQGIATHKLPEHVDDSFAANQLPACIA